MKDWNVKTITKKRGGKKMLYRNSSYMGEQWADIPVDPLKPETAKAGHYGGFGSGYNVTIEDGEVRYWVAPIEKDGMNDLIARRQAVYGLVDLIVEKANKELQDLTGRMQTRVRDMANNIGLPVNLRYSYINAGYLIAIGKDETPSDEPKAEGNQ